MGFSLGLQCEWLTHPSPSFSLTDNTFLPWKVLNDFIYKGYIKCFDLTRDTFYMKIRQAQQKRAWTKPSLGQVKVRFKKKIELNFQIIKTCFLHLFFLPCLFKTIREDVFAFKCFMLDLREHSFLSSKGRHNLDDC